MPIHSQLPQTLTPENLADWIQENEIKDEHIKHIDKVDLSEEEIAEHEHKSALASRAILKLEEIKKAFNDTLKDGTTPLETEDDGTVIYAPADFTIPPTKGMKALKANVEYHSGILEKGYKEDITDIYMIPAPDIKKVVAVTIEGVEWPDYTREMSADELDKYGKLFSEREAEAMEVEYEGEIDQVEVVSNNTAKKATKTMPNEEDERDPPSEDTGMPFI